MVEILGKDLDNWDNSIAAREPFHLSETGKTGAKFMTGADLLRSAKITSVWKDPVAIYAQAYSPYAKASQPVLSLGRSTVDTLANFLPGLASVGAQTYLETVSLLSDREYPLTKYAKRIIANTTEDVENRRMVRELYNQSGNIDSEKWYNEAGSIIGAMLPTMAAGNLAWTTTRTLGASRAAATRIASDVVKGFVGAEMAGQYAEETAAQYLQRTGDKNFENFTARDATGLTAAAYGAIGAQIEFIGGVEPIMAGALSKVGLRTGLLKAGAKIGVGEATEELLQGLTETLLRKIDGSSEKTWKEGFEESLKGAAWGLFIGGTMGSTAFHVNRRNLVKGIKTTFPNVTNEEATQIADAMIDNVGEISSQDPTLRNVLRQKVALMYESADIENKEGTIDAITDLEYSLIAADSAERGIDIAENPLFKGEVNALGWFREGIPEARRAEIEGYVKELADLKDQLKTLNEAKEKDWAKIDEIENKLDKFNSYVLEKLSDIARADGRQVAKILDDMEGTFVQKEKERRFVPPTPEERIEIDNKTTAIQEDLQKDGFEVNKKQYVNYTSGDGATYLYVSGKGQTPLVVRIGVSPIGRYHRRVNANFNANMSTEEILTALRNMIDSGNIPNNRKGQNVNIGFATRPSSIVPIFQEEISLYEGDTITVDGKERTVYNSNGDRIAKSKEALTNFWKWFGDSKVVDEQGRPLVVYHGTNVEFSEFEGDQIYFSQFSDIAGSYGIDYDPIAREGIEPNLYSVYLKMENPLNIRSLSDFKKVLDSINAPKDSAYRQMEKLLSPDFNFSSLDYDLQQLYSSRENMENRTWTALYLTHQQDIIKYAKENGFDGILDLEQSNQGGWSYNGFIAFEPNQIKSVDNRGTFSEDTGNIYWQNRVSGGAPATYRGAYIPEYRFILRANRMDASTLSHELAHDWFETNFARYRSGEATPDFMRAWGALEKALGVEEGAKVAPRKASETFARAYEGWVMNKSDWEKAINVDDKDKDDIVKLMQDYQNNLRDIYQDLTNPYFKQTWGKLGELKPELVKWFDRMTNIRDLDRLVERGEMSEAEASQEKLNRAIDTVIENTTDPESKQRLEYARTLNDTQRYEVEGGNKNSIQRRLGALAQAIDENNMLIKENYDTRRDMLEVAKQADNFVRTRLDDALAIINGQMAEQEGLFKEDIYTALERLALEEGDLGLLDELKNSEIANRLAKELGQRVAGFRNWSGGEMDVVSSLKALDNRFNKALQNKKAQAQLQEAEQMFAKAQAEQDKLADKQLEATLKELECK